MVKSVQKLLVAPSGRTVKFPPGYPPRIYASFAKRASNGQTGYCSFKPRIEYAQALALTLLLVDCDDI
jgi:hypothetical protein